MLKNICGRSSLCHFLSNRLIYRDIRHAVPKAVRNTPTSTIGKTQKNTNKSNPAKSLASTLDDMSDNVNDLNDFENIKKMSRKSNKLSHSLETKDVDKELTAKGIGVLDSFGVDISDVLNEGLHSSSIFYGMIPGSQQPGDIIEIQHVKVNKDCSHIMAYWTAPFMTKFIELVRDARGEVEASRLHEKMSKNMSLKLQKREPQFRSLLIKKMEFRRVPHITFKEYTKKVIKKLKQKRSNDGMHFV